MSGMAYMLRIDERHRELKRISMSRYARWQARRQLVLEKSTRHATPGGHMSSEKRLRTKLVALRMTPDEHHRISQAAHQIGMSLGGYLRAAAINGIKDIEGVAP